MESLQKIKNKIEEMKVKYNLEREEDNSNHSDGFGMYWSGFFTCLKEISQFVDTLEVKEVELKKDFQLTWEDVAWIVNEAFLKCKVESTLTAEDICKDVLKQFKVQKGKDI